MRFEVKVVMVQEHSFTVDADDVGEAAAKAFGMAAARGAEKWDVKVEVEKGVNERPR